MYLNAGWRSPRVSICSEVMSVISTSYTPRSRLVLSRFQCDLSKNDIPAAAAIMIENTTNGITGKIVNERHHLNLSWAYFNLPKLGASDGRNMKEAMMPPQWPKLMMSAILTALPGPAQLSADQVKMQGP